MLKVETDIPDVWIVEPTLFGDDRGFFMETWRHEWFKAATDKPFVQDNHSKSVQGTLRGLHYQTKYTQGKFIRVLDGQIYDVVVDLRKKITYVWTMDWYRTVVCKQARLMGA